jgi:hypothetical protein
MNRRSCISCARPARHHPDGQLYGYQAAVEPQVRAIFQALKLDASITYVNSIVSFNPEEGSRSQRVRLPRQALDEQQANCLDGALLFASLLEAASLNPALVILPNHALVALAESTGSRRVGISRDNADQLGHVRAGDRHWPAQG